MLNIYRKTIYAKKLQELKSLKAGSWLNYTNITNEEMDEVVGLSGLERGDIKDIYDQYEVPRIERHETATIIFARTPATSGEHATILVTIVLTKDYLITLSANRNKVLEEIVSSNKIPPTTQKAKLLVFLFLMIAKAYTSKIQKVTDQSNRQKKRLDSVDGADIVQMTKNEDVLNQYMASLVPMRNVFNTILNGKYISLYEEDTDLFEDLINSIHQSVDVCEVQVKSIRSLRDAYQIIFTNDLNKVMKLLTSFTILLTIPTIVSSVYGMNIILPLSGHPQAFLVVMGIAFGISGLLFWIFWRKKWF